MTEKMDYAALIADLENKINALQAALSSLRTAQALGALGQAGEGVELSNGTLAAAFGDSTLPTELPEGAFLQKSIPAAVKLFLSAARKKQTVKQITTALREGGVESKADSFENVITGTLNRLKNAGEVLRFKDGWGLSEWYPSHLRGTPSAQVKSAKKGKKAAKKAPKKRSVAAKTAPAKEDKPTAAVVAESPSAEQQIIALFQKNPRRELSKQEVIEKLQMRSQTATFILSKLAYRNILTKTEAGTYRMATA
jgi:hypothetical protein